MGPFFMGESPPVVRRQLKWHQSDRFPRDTRVKAGASISSTLQLDGRVFVGVRPQGSNLPARRRIAFRENWITHYRKPPLPIYGSSYNTVWFG